MFSPSNLSNILISLAIALSSSIVYYVVLTHNKHKRALDKFRQRVHPLPILPGAKPLLGANHGVQMHLGRDICRKVTDWHKKYGKTFGWLYGTRPCVSTIDLDLIKLITQDEQHEHINRMPLNTVMLDFEIDSMYLAEDEKWRRIRRVFGPALKKLNNHYVTHEVETSVGKLIESLDEKLLTAKTTRSWLEVSLSDLMHRFTLDSVFRCLYKQPNLIDYKQSTCEWVENVDEALRAPIDRGALMRLRLIVPQVGPILYWFVKQFTHIGKWQAEVRKFIRQQTRAVFEARGGNEKMDTCPFFVDLISEQLLNGKLGKNEFFETSFLLFSAGDKTVCDALVSTLRLLGAHPQIQSRLRDSIQAHGIESKYLDAVICESLRLHPPVPSGCSRTIIRDIQTSDGKHIIPAGTYVMMPTYTIHRCVEYWGERASEFWPDRWLEEEGAHELATRSGKFMPFGAGLRSCPGRQYALYESKVLLTNLLTRYEFFSSARANDDDVDEHHSFDSPYMLYILHNSQEYIRLRRLVDMHIITQILVALIVILSAALATLIIHTIVKSQVALWHFKRKARNVPILEKAKLIGNHVDAIYLRKNCSRQLMLWHEKYGKTFGWLFGTRPAVSSIDLDLIKTFVHDEPQAHINRMPFNSTRKEFEFSSIFTAENEQWRRIRRAFAPALKSHRFRSPNVMLEIQNTIDKLINAIENKLRRAEQRNEVANFTQLATSQLSDGEAKLNNPASSATVELNADDMLHRYQMSLIFSCFYKQSELIDFNARSDKWVDIVEESLGSVIDNPFVRLCMKFPIFRPIIDWATLNFHKAGVWRRDLMKFVRLQTKLSLEARRQLVEMKTKNTKSGINDHNLTINEDNFILKDGTQFKRNLIDYVIDQYHDGKLSTDEYLNSSNFLFAAADKTAADSLSHTVYQLACHPNVQDKLRESIRADGMESQYLTHVLHESLRLFPPVPIGCSRTITRDIETSDGKLIPAGTYVLTPAYVIHRLTEYWGTDANEFRPERWQEPLKHPCQFLGFGYGVRQCVGKEFAMHEMRMLFTALLLRYKFELSRPKDDIETFDAPLMVFTVPNSPTYIKLSRV